MNIKLGSLFDGSGGFPLAGYLCDIEPVWASEIEPYPIAVTKSRFTEKNYNQNSTLSVNFCLQIVYFIFIGKTYF
jgi:DNA (cytosine-5)-methyltransferase 1